MSGEFASTSEILKPLPTVAILDGGAQYALDIEQQVKRLGHNAVRLPFDTPIEELYTYGAVIMSGGPESVYDPDSPKPDPRLFTERDGRPPVLGICYGKQLINYALGGQVEKLNRREDGFTNVSLVESTLMDGLGQAGKFVMSHGDTVTGLAPGFEAVAYSGDLIAAIANDSERLYGVQFHPEVSPEIGPELLRNFLQKIAGLEADYQYTYEELINDAVAEVRESVGEKHVLAYISGGVDSSALAKLLERALPKDQFSLVLVDHGLMREGEVEAVTTLLADSDIQVMVYDAEAVYEQATTTIEGQETLPLNQVSDPEVKRKIIGDTFITIQRQMADALWIDPDDYILAMGTLYTDLIESGSKLASDSADTIKTHHNDTPLVREMRGAGRVLEPWRFLQKDDVREVGRLLGLSEEIYTRQPFPGPGLAIRIICGDRPFITDNSPDIAQQLATFNQSDVKVALLPIRSVGLQGDNRTYAHLAGLRDNGTRDWFRLKALADEIPRQVHEVNRVAYIFGSTSEDYIDGFTPTFINPVTRSELRLADSLVTRRLHERGLHRTISQVPVVLLPLNFGEPGKRSIFIRTFKTVNFKTGDVAIPGVDFDEAFLYELVDELLALPNIAKVIYDLTSKPPATTELE